MREVSRDDSAWWVHINKCMCKRPSFCFLLLQSLIQNRLLKGETDFLRRFEVGGFLVWLVFFFFFVEIGCWGEDLKVSVVTLGQLVFISGNLDWVDFQPFL